MPSAFTGSCSRWTVLSVIADNLAVILFCIHLLKEVLWAAQGRAVFPDQPPVQTPEHCHCPSTQLQKKMPEAIIELQNVQRQSQLWPFLHMAAAFPNQSSLLLRYLHDFNFNHCGRWSERKEDDLTWKSPLQAPWLYSLSPEDGFGWHHSTKVHH